MSFDDEDDGFDCDMFDDDNIIAENGISASFNPLHERLISQLTEVDDHISEVMKQTSELAVTCDSALRKIYRNCTLIDAQCTSDSDSEWYDKSGVPMIKRCKQERVLDIAIQVTILSTWQRIIDDKWILGVELENKTNWMLEQPDFYVALDGEKSLSGTCSFWVITNESFTLWNRTSQIPPECKNICVTAVLNLPNFRNTTKVKAFGTILYIADGHEYQTPITSFELTALQAIDKTLSPRCSAEISYSILAMKSIAVEKVMAISLEKHHNYGQKLLEFLQTQGFAEIISDTFVSKNGESFRHCLIEILSVATPELHFRISARSMAQLNIIIRLLTEECPGITEVQRQDKLTTRFTALEKEMELKQRSTDLVALRMAEGRTDLLMLA